MDNDVYEYFVTILGILGVLVNIIAFCLIHFKSPIKCDYTIHLIKWGRIPEVVISLIGGIILQPRIIFPVIGVVTSVKYLSFLNDQTVLCYLAVVVLLSASTTVDFVFLTFLSKFNIFVRGKSLTYFHWIESSLFVFCSGFVTIFILILTPGVGQIIDNNNANYSSIYEDPIILHSKTAVIFVVNTSLQNPSFIILIFQIIFKTGFICYAIPGYYIPLELALKACMREARIETATIIKNSLIYLKTSAFLPVVVALTPIIIPYGLSLIENVPLSIFLYSRDFGLIGLLTYCVISPIIQLLFVFKKVIYKWWRLKITKSKKRKVGVTQFIG